MPFGDFIKSQKAAQNAATLSPDLGSNPISGNLLIVTASNGSSSVTMSTPPSGFTLLTSSIAGSGTWYWYFKISDGTEQSISITWTAAGDSVVTYAEYEWDGSTPVVTTNDDTTNISSNTNSQTSGAATPSGATNICLALHSTDGNKNSFSGQAVDGAWIEDILFSSIGNNYGEGKLSRLVSVTGSQEGTHTDTDTGDQMYGAIAVFDVGVSGISASGAATLAAATASGSAKVVRRASGGGALAPPSASGSAKVVRRASGGGALAPPSASGSAKAVRKASGSGVLVAATASGNAKIVRSAAGGAVASPAVASGAAKKRVAASGAATVTPIVGSGTASIPGSNIIASGGATTAPAVASGTARVVRKAAGGATLAAASSSGLSRVVRKASGSGSLVAAFAASLARIIRKASGNPVLTPFTAAGNAIVGGATIISTVDLESREIAIALDSNYTTIDLASMEVAAINLDSRKI